MPKESKRTRSGMDWTVISQSVAAGVVIVVLNEIAFGLRLHELPLVGLVFQFFTPVAFVVMIAYSRSEQKTRAQAAMEGLFAGCALLVVLSLVIALAGVLRPVPG